MLVSAAIKPESDIFLPAACERSCIVDLTLRVRSTICGPAVCDAREVSHDRAIDGTVFSDGVVSGNRPRSAKGHLRARQSCRVVHCAVRCKETNAGRAG